MRVTQRMATVLRERIASGKYRGGDQLPPLRELSEELGGSYVMVSRAIRELKEEGLVEASPGRGTFVTDRAARMILPGGGRRIGFVFADPVDNPREEYQMDLFVHIQQRLRGAGYVDSALRHDTQALDEPESMAGAILIHRSKLLPRFREWGIPVVCCSSTGEEGFLSGVSPDFYNGSYLATRRLIAAGHRRIGVVLTAEEDNRASFVPRHQGYLDAMGDAGLSALDPVHWHARFATAELQELLKKAERPTALFVSNDHMAVEIIDFCHTLGISVPGEISICGLENMHSGQLSNPPLTTVGYDRESLADEVVSLLFALIDGREKGVVQKKIPMNLVERNSIASIRIS